MCGRAPVLIVLIIIKCHFACNFETLPLATQQCQFHLQMAVPSGLATVATLDLSNLASLPSFAETEVAPQEAPERRDCWHVCMAIGNEDTF